MKKIFFATILLSVAFFATSCQKEDNWNEQTYGPITINAVTEGIDISSTRASTAYKYDVLWETGDQIMVKGQTSSSTFTLTNGAGTTMGTFTQDNAETLSGEVEGFYPVSIISGNSPEWPSEQDNSQVPPMYCKKSITGKTEEFSFRSLGAMLQIVLSTTDSDITLSSIRISDASKPLSGTFTVSDGKATMTSSSKSAIVLNTGETKIGNAAKYFNIAVPAGKYDNLKLTFFTNDGRGVAMYSTTMPEILHNTVAKISLCAKNFKPVPTGFSLDLETLDLPVGGHHKLLPQFTPADTYNKKVLWTSSNPAVATVGADGMVKAIAPGSTTINAQLEDEIFASSCSVTVTTPADAPAGALSGLFSVSDNKVVRFAKGNLYKTDTGWGFFDEQYIGQSEGKNGDLTWNQWHEWLTTDSGTGWSVLSSSEWEYLVGNNDSRKGMSVNGVTVAGIANCLVLYPDGYAGDKPTDADKTTIYASSEKWAQAEDDGAVCITSDIIDGKYFYWASNKDRDYYRIFNLSDLRVWSGMGPNYTSVLRPVTEVK